jgi:hypothetical protein
MGGECSNNGRDENSSIILVWKPKEKTLRRVGVFERIILKRILK